MFCARYPIRADLPWRQSWQFPSRVGHVGELRVLGSLQRADIGDNGPAIMRFDARSIWIHHAKAVGDDVEEMLGRCTTQACAMVGRRRRKSPLHDHAVALAGKAMAWGAEDVEALPSSFEQRRRYRWWLLDFLVPRQITLCDSPGWQRLRFAA